MFASSPKRHDLLLHVGKRIFYDVDHEFLRKANKWFTQEGLRFYIINEREFNIVAVDGPGFTESVDLGEAAIDRAESIASAAEERRALAVGAAAFGMPAVIFPFIIAACG